MMRLPTPFPEQLIYEVKYSRGHRYLDRCGQTMLDIEDLNLGWLAGEATPSGCTMFQIDRNLHCSFDSYSMRVVQVESENTDEFESAFRQVFPLILRDIGAGSIARLGVRFILLFAVTSIEEGESRLKQAGLFTVASSLTSALAGSIKNQQLILRCEDEAGVGARLDLGVVTREKAEMPAEVLKIIPSRLSKHQRELLTRKFEETNRYRKDPRFSIRLDLDIYREEPESDDYLAFWKSANTTKDKVLALLGAGT
ncbi:MAG: hypothetical protein ACYCW6_19935 [Candidatus Xenobia bacterium]